MKHLITSLSLLLAGATVSAQEMVRYELDVNEFTDLKVVDGINVDYESNPAMTGKAVFETTADMAPAIIFEPNKAKLTIKLLSSDTPYTNLPTIKVYSSYLNKVENCSDSTLRVLNVAPQPKFSGKLEGNGRLVIRNLSATQVDLSIFTGSGTIVAFGKCSIAKLKLKGGSAQIQADELEANDVSCSLWGTGSINCYPLQHLSVSGVGSGTVYYRGQPELKIGGLNVNIKVRSIDNPQ